MTQKKKTPICELIYFEHHQMRKVLYEDSVRYDETCFEGSVHDEKIMNVKGTRECVGV